MKHVIDVTKGSMTSFPKFGKRLSRAATKGHRLGSHKSDSSVASLFIGLLLCLLPSFAFGQTLLYTLIDPNPQGYDWFGNTVAAIGDVNSDAVPDIAVGAPAAWSWQGQALIFSGADGSPIRTLDDPSPHFGAGFGWSLAGIGDVNGDSVPDIAIAAYWKHVDSTGQGQAYVFSGADGSLIHILDDPNPQLYGGFGRSLTGVGDVNGDTVPDIAVGAPWKDINAGQGQAYVFSGADGSLIHILDNPTPEPFEQFGDTVAAIGDVNGDAVPDIAVGAPFARYGGQAIVFSGADGSVIYVLNNVTLQFANDSLGKSLAGIGDVNGDAVPDIAVGIPYQYVDGVLQGQVLIFSGADGSLIHVIDNPNPEPIALFGYSLAAMGDINGDLVPDLAVGAPRHHTQLDPVIRQAFVFSGADGSLIRTLNDPGLQGRSRFGYSLAAIGDINGDLVPDLAVGAPWNLDGYFNQGQVFVFDLNTDEPVERLNSLVEGVAMLNLNNGIDNSLDAKLDAAVHALEDLNANNDVAAVKCMESFINAVEAQRGRKLSEDQADALIAAAQIIIGLLVGT